MKIELVSSNPEYGKTWNRWRQEPVSLAFNPAEVITDEEAAQLLENQRGSFATLFEQEKTRWFARKDGLLVGTLSVEQINKRMLSASFGYQVSDEFAGQGIATTMVKQFVDQVFQETKLGRLIATVHKDHGASRRILKKNGFTEEGLLREYLILDGKRVDFYLYSILRSDPKR